MFYCTIFPLLFGFPEFEPPVPDPPVFPVFVLSSGLVSVSPPVPGFWFVPFSAFPEFDPPVTSLSFGLLDVLVFEEGLLELEFLFDVFVVFFLESFVVVFVFFVLLLFVFVVVGIFFPLSFSTS